MLTYVLFLCNMIFSLDISSTSLCFTMCQCFILSNNSAACVT
uniref:Uncharacterized protein n=1 Tax=Arundo donax TaxID=35708 RepID=A0A0A9F1K5_ARUDO